MFFPRLRRQAKWAFAVMVIVFAGGFVFLGVGSGGLDLGSLLRDAFSRSSSSGPSISKALDRVNKHPRDAAAQKQLAKAYEAKGRIPEAVATYQQYIALKPKDADALGHLAALQKGQADTYLQQAQIAYQQQSFASSGSTFGIPATSKFGKALGTDPITNLVQTQTSTAFQQANSQYTSASQAAIATYKKLAKVQPSQENLLTLAHIAEGYQDITTAVGAYKQALKETTDPSLKAQIRAAIKTLQPAAPKGSGR
jgi:tetratricopeptide (TPR) repeat protein